MLRRLLPLLLMIFMAIPLAAPTTVKAESGASFTVDNTTIVASQVMSVTIPHNTGCMYNGDFYFIATVSNGDVRVCKWNGAVLSYIGDPLPYYLKFQYENGGRTIWTSQFRMIDDTSAWFSTYYSDNLEDIRPEELKKFSLVGSTWTLDATVIFHAETVPADRGWMINNVLRLASGDFLVCTLWQYTPRYYGVNKYAWSLVSGESLVNTIEIPVNTINNPYPNWGGQSSWTAIEEADGTISTYMARDGIKCISKFSMEIDGGGELALISQDWEWLAAFNVPAPSIEKTPDMELPYLRALPGKMLVYQNFQRTQDPGNATNAYSHLAWINTDNQELLHVSTNTLDRAGRHYDGYYEGQYWSVYTPKTLFSDPTYLECELVFDEGDGVEQEVLLRPYVDVDPQMLREEGMTGADNYIVAEGRDGIIYIVEAFGFSEAFVQYITITAIGSSVSFTCNQTEWEVGIVRASYGYQTGLTWGQLTNNGGEGLDITIAGRDMKDATENLTWVMFNDGTHHIMGFGMKCGLASYNINITKNAPFNYLVEDLAGSSTQTFGLEFSAPSSYLFNEEMEMVGAYGHVTDDPRGLILTATPHI